mgnify:CR=1 FL=1
MPKAKPVAAADPDQTWMRPAHQARSREQRDRLLKAGERAFAAQGFWRTHVTDITRRAGCSVGSFYRRFRDKEAFFMALQADMATRAEANIARFLAHPLGMVCSDGGAFALEGPARRGHPHPLRQPTSIRSSCFPSSGGPCAR